MKHATPIFLLCALAPQAHSSTFIDNSNASLKLRNFYFNTDNRNSGSSSANYVEEWGQGFQFEFSSGFTEGIVGVGIDALGLAGVRLDSGRGRHGNPNSTSYGGALFPTDGDGRAENEFSHLGLTAKAKIAATELKYGTLMPKLPVISYNDGRLLPQTYEGVEITSKEIHNATIVGGQVKRSKGRNSSNSYPLSIAGANNPNGGKFSNKFYYAGIDYKWNGNLLIQYYYGELDQFYKQNFVGLNYKHSIAGGILTTDLRSFYSSAVGANDRDPRYFTSGWYGNTSTGKVDNRLSSVLLTYTNAGHTFGTGYQISQGKSDFPWLNQGDGSTSYLITDMQIQKFARAGERTWQARYSFDLAAVGLPGANFGLVYLKGSDIDSKISDRKEWERDFTLSYTIQSGPVKGLGLTWKNATWRNNIPGANDQDENRLILSYTIPLL
ncbi:OprD family porin [Pseudomonas sp. Marseille-QA0332]